MNNSAAQINLNECKNCTLYIAIWKGGSRGALILVLVSVSGIKWRHLHTHTFLHFPQLPAAELTFLQALCFAPFVPSSAAMIFSQSGLFRKPPQKCKNSTHEFIQAPVHLTASAHHRLGMLKLCGATATAIWMLRCRPGPYANSAIGCKHGFFLLVASWWNWITHPDAPPGSLLVFPFVTRVLFVE